MAFTQISTTNIQPNTVVEYATYSSFTTALAPKVSSVNVANSAFSILDDAAVNTGGGYIVVTGQNFADGATVLIDATQATAVTRISIGELRVQVPAKSAATYNLYVVNPDGGTGIRVNGITYSANPSWVTSSPLTGQEAIVAFAVSLSATGATSYALTAGSTIPTGTTLLANGYFYGAVTISTETTYSFTVRASDAELQESDKTFQITITPSSKLFTWGRQSAGTLGDNIATNSSKSSPGQVGSGTTWAEVEVNRYDGQHSLALKRDGTLWTWGSNFRGQLGLNLPGANYKSSPTQIGSSTDWASISAGRESSGAIKTTGTLWLWGNQSYGAMAGAGPGGGNASSPTQIGSLTNWSKLAKGDTTAMAIKTDGTLWAWGQNTDGHLGINSVSNNVDSPVQVGAGTTWSEVSVGQKCVMAIKTDGTLWAWGLNDYGQLGLGNIINRSSPTQVGAGTTWMKVTSGHGTGAAIKTDGTLWTWGRNDRGQLGLNLNSGIYTSSPSQVGSST